MANVQHRTLFGDALHNPFKFGPDASKAASPTVGMWYFANDTGILYRCAVSGVWQKETYLLGTKEIDETGIANGYAVKWDATAMKLVFGPVGSLIESGVLSTITQVGHSFNIGDILRYDGVGAQYVKALADSPNNANVTGIVYDVVNANSFKLLYAGAISGLSGLGSGIMYYLSSTTPGGMVATPPSALGTVIKPVLTATSATTGIFVNMATTQSSSMSSAFTNASLAGGVLSVTHNLNNKFCHVTVYDETNKIVIPDEVTAVNSNLLTITLTSHAPISGTWNVIVTK